MGNETIHKNVGIALAMESTPQFKVRGNKILRRQYYANSKAQ